VFSSVHQPFSWLADDARRYPLAEFVALTLDVSNGIESCLELVESSFLDQIDLDPEGTELPTISPYDAGKLLRLAIAAARLLRDHAERKIDWINKCRPQKS
jgi:hypothetical protein